MTYSDMAGLSRKHSNERNNDKSQDSDKIGAHQGQEHGAKTSSLKFPSIDDIKQIISNAAKAKSSSAAPQDKYRDNQPEGQYKAKYDDFKPMPSSPDKAKTASSYASHDWQPKPDRSQPKPQASAVMARNELQANPQEAVSQSNNTASLEVSAKAISALDNVSLRDSQNNQVSIQSVSRGGHPAFIVSLNGEVQRHVSFSPDTSGKTVGVIHFGPDNHVSVSESGGQFAFTQVNQAGRPLERLRVAEETPPITPVSSVVGAFSNVKFALDGAELQLNSRANAAVVRNNDGSSARLDAFFDNKRNIASVEVAPGQIHTICASKDGGFWKYTTCQEVS